MTRYKLRCVNILHDVSVERDCVFMIYERLKRSSEGQCYFIVFQCQKKKFFYIGTLYEDFLLSSCSFYCEVTSTWFLSTFLFT